MIPPFAAEAEVRQRFPDAEITWRLAIRGIGKAFLGLAYCGTELCAVQKVAFGDPNVSFLRRELNALRYLAAIHEVRGSIPTLDFVDDRPDYLALLENAFPGRSLLVMMRSGVPGLPRQHKRWLATGADWIVRFQKATLKPAREMLDVQATLAEKIRNHLSLSSRARDLLIDWLHRHGRCEWQSAAHGDYWGANLIIGGDGARVVDWTEFKPAFHPYHDPGFFLLTYARDYVTRMRPRLRVSEWLPLAFKKGRRVDALVDFFLQRYTSALGLGTPDQVRAYLPLTMAHYACYGQDAPGWTAACEVWAEQPELFTR
jgi:hypothetical protein